jgi:hypothetical protein
MRKLLHWLTRDDVARTNAAQASVRLQHRRHDRNDIATYLTEHATAHESPDGRRMPTTRQRTALAGHTLDGEPQVPSPGQPPDAPQPPEWALGQAASDLYDVDDPVVIAECARELARTAQEREDERHDEYDDPDQGGEA